MMNPVWDTGPIKNNDGSISRSWSTGETAIIKGVMVDVQNDMYWAPICISFYDKNCPCPSCKESRA